MKKFLAVLLTGIVVLTPLAMAQTAQEAPKVVLHQDLADILIKMLGLVRYLPNAPSTQQQFDLLMQNGILPEKGWEAGAVVTKADLARVLVQALQRTDDVENPNDPQSWIDALREMGISLDRLSESIQAVEVLPESMGQNISLGSIDPLIYSPAHIDNVTQYSVDLDMVARVFSEIEMSEGSFRPIPPTPH